MHTEESPRKTHHIPRRSGVGTRFVAAAVKRHIGRRRWEPFVEIVDYGEGYKAIVRKHPARDGRGTTVQVINENRDRTLPGKRRRLTRKAARRAVQA